MTLKRLSTAEMIEISERWAKEGATRKLLLSLPEVALILRKVDEAHEALEATEGPPSDPTLRRIADDAALIDDRHDALIRGLHLVLSGFANLATDSGAIALIGQLHEALLPNGLVVTQRSYGEEAEAARLLEERLSPALRERLADLPMPGGSLLDAVDEWLEAAQRLGELEAERAARAKELSHGEGDNEVAARNSWIRAVSALVTNLEVAGADAAMQMKVLGPLREAVKSAERRAAGGKK